MRRGLLAARSMNVYPGSHNTNREALTMSDLPEVWVVVKAAGKLARTIAKKDLGLLPTCFDWLETRAFSN